MLDNQSLPSQSIRMPLSFHHWMLGFFWKDVEAKKGSSHGPTNITYIDVFSKANLFADSRLEYKCCRFFAWNNFCATTFFTSKSKTIMKMHLEVLNFLERPREGMKVPIYTPEN